MAENDAVEMIGLGVDLIGGPQTLAILREIRAEYQLINQLSGRGATGGGSGQLVSGREKALQDRANQLGRDRVALEKQVSDEEINIRALAANKKLEINQRVNQRAEQLRQQEKTRQVQFEKDEADRHREALNQRRLRIQAYSRLPGIAERDLTSERKSFQRYRRDPARDEQTNVYRRQIAEELQGQRIAQREKARAEDQIQQQAIAAAAQRKAQFRREIQTLTDKDERDRAIAARRIAANTRSSLYDSALIRRRDGTIGEAETINDALGRLPRRTLRLDAQGNPFSPYYNAPQLNAPAGTGSRSGSNLDLTDVSQLSAGQYQQLLKAGRIDAKTGAILPPRAPTGGPSGGGPSGPPPPNFRRSGALNERGFFTTGDAVGRITRNILLYEGISLATRGLSEYIVKSIQAAKTSVDLGNGLVFATQQANGNVEANRALAVSLQGVGLSRSEGFKTVTQAARFTQGRPDDTSRLVQVITDVAASRGLGVNQSDQLIDALRARKPRIYEELFNTKPEDLYKQAANRSLDTQSGQGFTGVTGGDYETRAQKITKYVSALSDAQKHEIELNYILSQSSRFQGEAAERANTLAGRIDKVSAAFSNTEEVVGLFVTDIKPVNSLLENLGNRFASFEKYRAPQIARSGPGGTISESDIQGYGTAKAYGPRAELLNSVNNNLGPTLETGALAGFGYLFGRSKANEASRVAEYYKQLDIATLKYEGNLKLAVQEATTLSQNTRAGFFRSVSAGLQRGTYGLTQSLAENIVGPQFASRIGASTLRKYSAPYGQTQEEFRAAQSEFNKNALIPGRFQAASGVAGGLAGTALGATLGSLVASKLDTGPITATGLTILGAISGNAIGTFAGDAAGRALTGSALGRIGGAAAGGLSVGGAVAGSVLTVAAVAAYIGTSEYKAYADRALRGIEATEEARRKQAQETQRAVSEGRLTYRDTATGQQLTPEEYQNAPGKDIQSTGRRTSFRPTGNDTVSLIGRALDFLLPGRQGPASTDTRVFQDARYQQRISADPVVNIRTREGLEQGLANVSRRTGGLTPAQMSEEIETLNRSIGRLQKIDPKDLQIVDKVELQRETERVSLLNDALSETQKLRDKQELLSQYGTTDENYINKTLIPYRDEAGKREATRKEKELTGRSEYVSQLTNALSKLRDARQGAFRLPGDIGTSLEGEDNPYVKVLADEATAAERMRQQWGFLGKAATQYFTTLEQGAIKRQLNKLEFSTYTTASNLRGQADRELAIRNGPGLSRADQDYLDIQSAIVDKAVQLPKLWAQTAEVLGRYVSPIRQLQGRVSSLQLATGIGAEGKGPFGRIEGFSAGERTSTFVLPNGSQITTVLEAGRSNDYAQFAAKSASLANLSPQARRAVTESYADTALSIFGEFSPQQIRQAGLAQTYAQAAGLKAGGLDRRIQEAQDKAIFNAQEDQRLQAQLKADEQFRRAQLAKGYDPRDVGRESDSLLLARTDNIAPKDLSFEQFRGRQEALRRQADRTEADRQEAQAAVNQGLAYQAQMVDLLAQIRAGILGGNMSLLVQVQNDTQARIDQSALQELSSGRYNIPLDTGESKTSPYTKSFDRYGRGGRK